MKLGQKVECLVTGFSGIATGIAEYLHGCERVEVQSSMDKDGKVEDSVMFDLPQLKVIDKKQVVKSKTPKSLIKLGQRITDPISGMEGIATGRVVHLNGCARILMSIKADKEGKHQPGTWFDEPLLKIVKEKREVKQGLRTTGGPCEKPSREPS